MKALDKKDPLDLVKFYDRRNPIGRKWVLKKNLNVEGRVEKYKGHLVEKRYS